AVSAIYFTVSTVATVGPGDLVPATSVGRICTTMIIFGGLCMVALALHRVEMVFQNSVKGLGSYRFRRKRRHVVVTGNPDSQMALDLISEIYHEDGISAQKATTWTWFFCCRYPPPTRST
ncbi:unnamed protein product, partial [Prorocentrum cordatum]